VNHFLPWLSTCQTFSVHLLFPHTKWRRSMQAQKWKPYIYGGFGVIKNESFQKSHRYSWISFVFICRIHTRYASSWPPFTLITKSEAFWGRLLYDLDEGLFFIAVSVRLGARNSHNRGRSHESRGVRSCHSRHLKSRSNIWKIERL